MKNKFITGIKNLWLWKKVIWNDRWWDYIYLLKLIKFKLELMEKHFKNDSFGVDACKLTDKMRICILLLDRLIHNEYDVYKNYFLKWGDFELDTVNDNLTITQKNVITDDDKIKSEKEFKRLVKHETKLLTQDLNYLCKLFNKHLITWWD